MSKFILQERNYMFHVHTNRCKHAFHGISDEEIVKTAIRKGATNVYFSDHAPFPGNPFGMRMDYEQLDEYINSLVGLKEKYKNDILIHIGLEIEYFPSYDKEGYYEELCSKDGIEFLLLGQHMAEIGENPKQYSFSWNQERLDAEEYKVLGKAEIDGLKTGYFQVIAHPDRIFRRCHSWTDEMKTLSLDIIKTAVDNNVVLEQNISSMSSENHYWQQFWDLVPKTARKIVGLDAHSIDDLITRYNFLKNRCSLQ